MLCFRLQQFTYSCYICLLFRLSWCPFVRPFIWLSFYFTNNYYNYFNDDNNYYFYYLQMTVVVVTSGAYSNIVWVYAVRSCISLSICLCLSLCFNRPVLMKFYKTPCGKGSTTSTFNGLQPRPQLVFVTDFFLQRWCTYFIARCRFYLPEFCFSWCLFVCLLVGPISRTI